MHQKLWEKVLQYLRDQTTSATIAGYNTMSYYAPSGSRKRKRFKRLLFK
jgi:hypothetical protein